MLNEAETYKLNRIGPNLKCFFLNCMCLVFRYFNIRLEDTYPTESKSIIKKLVGLKQRFGLPIKQKTLIF